MQLTVNDRLLEADDSDSRTLLRYLRDALQLTGTKDGCDGAGHCGTCTVLVDGRPTLACRTAMQAVTGRHVLTIEGLSRRFHNGLHPVQQSFIDHHAVQCGFCTPGMILAAAALLDSTSAPTLENIKLALQGNLCRCTGYQKIFDAVLALPPLPRGEGGGVAVRPRRGVRPAVGLSVPNKGDENKVTGRETYSADIYRPGMLAGKVVWSEHPHAEIVEVDTESARTLPGVVAVLTAADVPGVNLHGPIIRDQPVLAQHKVRFIGEPVAVVLAETELQAEAAARAVHVAYRPLPPVFDPIEAMNPEAPLLHTDCPRNILTHQPVRIGDAARALDASAIVITGEYAVPFIEHAYLEPEAAVAEPDGQGGIKLWCGVQNQFQTLRQIAAALALPLERINMVNLPMGGAFGGKCDITVQALAALGALVTGRPVKIVLTRAESLRVHPKRHAFKMRYRTGVTQDGRLTGIDAEIVADTGAYASWGSITAETLATFVCGPYVVPNVHVDLYAVHTNNITAGAMRGFGAPEVAFAVESQMDRLARALSMDPFSFRAVNGIDRGQALYLGQVLEHSVGYQQTLSEVQRALAVHLPACKAIAQRTGRRLGVGVASGFKSVGFSANWPDPAAAEVRLLSSGHVQLSTGCADFGQGSMTTVAQIAAETLGVNY
ncbi:MAG: molybdopterin-dependent oxidoreductase, partial [Anaerolineales bacterium]